MIQQPYKYVSLGLWPCLMFSRAENHLHIEIIVGGDWKSVSYHGNKMFYSHRCVFCRTISLPSFSALCCKVAKIALFNIYMMQNWVEYKMMSSVISFAYFTHFSN